MNQRLKNEQDRLLTLLAGTEPATPEYAKYLARLYSINKLVQVKRIIDPATALTIGANLLGLVLVLRFEQLNILTGKAFSMIVKPRI